MPMLEITGLSKSFGENQAVDSIHLQVGQGEIYGLLGPNGAGKTTTISMISGLLRPDAGEVILDGKDFWSDPRRGQRMMGVVPQEIALYEELTGEENLIFWGKMAGLKAAVSRSRAVDMLEALALTDRRKEQVKTYSGGMKRRINIGCALMHQPRLLLLDEPTVGIDPQARLKILEFVGNLVHNGTSILYTTHYLEEAETLCKRIGIIDHGKLLAEGTLEELRERLGGDKLFILEGSFEGTDPASWPGFLNKFKVIRKSDGQITVSSIDQRDPSQCLKDLLDSPVSIANVTMKKPSLNEVFIQLTGRDLRE